MDVFVESNRIFMTLFQIAMFVYAGCVNALSGLQTTKSNDGPDTQRTGTLRLALFKPLQMEPVWLFCSTPCTGRHYRTQPGTVCTASSSHRSRAPSPCFDIVRFHHLGSTSFAPSPFLNRTRPPLISNVLLVSADYLPADPVQTLR